MYYSPVRHFTTPKSLSFDLHVLGAPPAFVLSQDQTLKNYTSFTRATTSTHFFFAVDFGYAIVKERLNRGTVENTGAFGGCQGYFREYSSEVYFFHGARTEAQNRLPRHRFVIPSAVRADGAD